MYLGERYIYDGPMSFQVVAQTGHIHTLSLTHSLAHQEAYRIQKQITFKDRQQVRKLE